MKKSLRLILGVGLALQSFGMTGCAADSAANATVRIETVAEGLEHPWGLAFLPDRRMLVTERPGRLRIVSTNGAVSKPLAGVPEVFAQGQGGLLDVALDPDFAASRLVYLSYAEPGQGGASTAVARGRLDGDRLQDVRVIFRQQPKVGGGNHFGSRLVFAPDGKLFVTQGDRFKFDPAQDLSNEIGKIVRINPDGSIPRDNPFVGKPGAAPAIWSYGHRNVQAAAMHPTTGALWEIEHGPRGGDELNIAEAGRNYGWPLVSWGNHYDGRDIPDPPTRPDLTPSLYQWTPVIAPSGMTFYSGKLFADWKNDLLVGGLATQVVVRLNQDGKSAREKERIDVGARVRDVVEGPEGAVYLLTDESRGKVLRLTPKPAGVSR
jgi:aldose sugar dehydrogenase